MRRYTPDTLPPRTLEVFGIIRRLSHRLGHSPSYRDIAIEAGLASNSTVWLHVQILIQAGLLQHAKGAKKAIIIVQRVKPTRWPAATWVRRCA